MNLSWGLLHAGLQTVLDTALDAVVVMDTDGMVIGWNAHSETCFGWSWSEARGRRLSDLIVPPEFRDGHEQGLRHYLSTGHGPVLDRRGKIAGVVYAYELTTGLALAIPVDTLRRLAQKGGYEAVPPCGSG